MQVVKNQDAIKPHMFDFDRTMQFLRDNCGQWVDIDAASMSGNSQQVRQTRLHQAARYRNMRIRTQAGKNGQVLAMYVGPRESPEMYGASNPVPNPQLRR
jgi:hypothetical protein